jgi:hypothetical protein
MSADDYYDVDLKYVQQELLAWLKAHFGEHMYFHKRAVWAEETGSLIEYRALLREWIGHNGMCVCPICRSKFNACLALVAHKEGIRKRKIITADELRADLLREIQAQREWADQ